MPVHQQVHVQHVQVDIIQVDQRVLYVQVKDVQHVIQQVELVQPVQRDIT